MSAASEAFSRPALTEGAADVGRRVRELREHRGMSLSELARRAAVGKATLSGLEAGTRNPTLDTLQTIATALDLPPDERAKRAALLREGATALPPQDWFGAQRDDLAALRR